MEGLGESVWFDFSHHKVKEFVKRHRSGKTKREQALSLYYAVRDEILYNPYEINLNLDKAKASYVISKGNGHCVDKSMLYVACLRSIGIPSKIGLAKVVNHIGAERMELILKSNVLAPHGYVEAFLEGRWVKATPVFNEMLCRMLNVKPLDFNGREDSIFQEYDRQGANFMEYIEDYGSFDKFPSEFIVSVMEGLYPHLFFNEEGDRVFFKGELIQSYLDRNNLQLNAL